MTTNNRYKQTDVEPSPAARIVGKVFNLDCSNIGGDRPEPPFFGCSPEKAQEGERRERGEREVIFVKCLINTGTVSSLI